MNGRLRTVHVTKLIPIVLVPRQTHMHNYLDPISDLALVPSTRVRAYR